MLCLSILFELWKCFNQVPNSEASKKPLIPAAGTKTCERQKRRKLRLKILTFKLVLFKPGWSDYAHHISTSPLPSGFSDLPMALLAPKPRGTKEKKTVTKDFSFVTLQLRRQFHSNSLRKKTRFTLLQSWSDWETQCVDLFSETAFLIRSGYTYLFHIEGKILLRAFYLLKTKIMKKKISFRNDLNPL